MSLNFNKEYPGYIVGKLPINYPRSSRPCFILKTYIDKHGFRIS